MNSDQESTKSVRLFIALPIPDKAKESLAQGIDEYKNYLDKKVPPENLHVTIIWLGNVENHEQYLEALTAPLPQSFLPIATVTHMGKGIKKNLLWAYLNPTHNLHKIREDLVNRLKKIDFPLPKDIYREFIPHITLANFSEEAENKAIADHPIKTTWQIQEAVLYESRSTDDGVRYIPLSSIPFTK